MSVLNAVSADEEGVRARLLRGFRAHDSSKVNVLHATQFQTVLRENGLRFGHPIVDRIMLLCHIDDSGNVDINRFAEVVELAGANVETDERGFAQPKLHSDLHKLSQADRVRRLAGDIHALFYKFDSGGGSLEEFRASLAALGINETHETKRLLRQTPISFRELLHSLTQTQTEVPADVPAGIPRTYDSQGSIIGGQGHFEHDRLTRKGGGIAATRERVMHDSDVITWTNDKKKDFHSHRAQGKYYHGVTETHFGIAWDKQLKKSSVADLMQDTDDHHFETTQQHAEAAGLNLHTGPGTSAGYHTSDEGMIREQIYSSIRQLDQGSLTSNDFRTRLQQLGIRQLPLDASRLLHQYECHGRVDFTKFVRAFEDYFRVATMPSPSKSQRPGTAPAATNADGIVGHFQKAHVTAPAGSDHGDIISWAKDASTSDEKIPGETRHHDASTWKAKQRSLRDSQTNILSWDKQGPDKERRHKLAGSPARGEHYDDNIITWEGAEPGPAPRPHKLAPPAGMGAQSQSVPYGTQLDLNAPPQASWATGSRKARVGSRAATGMWFNPVAPMPPSEEQMRASKRMQANNPNNLDHIGKGFAVPAEMFHSGKKQFGGSGSTGGVDHFYVPETVQGPGHQRRMFAEQEYAHDRVSLQ